MSRLDTRQMGPAVATPPGRQRHDHHARRGYNAADLPRAVGVVSVATLTDLSRLGLERQRTRGIVQAASRRRRRPRLPRPQIGRRRRRRARRATGAMPRQPPSARRSGRRGIAGGRVPLSTAQARRPPPAADLTEHRAWHLLHLGFPIALATRLAGWPGLPLRQQFRLALRSRVMGRAVSYAHRLRLRPGKAASRAEHHER